MLGPVRRIFSQSRSTTTQTRAKALFRVLKVTEVLWHFVFVLLYLCNAAIIDLSSIVLWSLLNHLIDIHFPRTRRELDGHAQTTADHVVVAGLGAECLVGHF